MKWQPALGAAFRLLRIRRDLSQTRIADDAGITKAMLSAFETGKQMPSLNSLGAILRALGADLRDLQDLLEDLEPSLFGRTDAKNVKAQAVEELGRQFHQMSQLYQKIGATLQVLEKPLDPQDAARRHPGAARSRGRRDSK